MMMMNRVGGPRDASASGASQGGGGLSPRGSHVTRSLIDIGDDDVIYIWSQTEDCILAVSGVERGDVDQMRGGDGGLETDASSTQAGGFPAASGQSPKGKRRHVSDLFLNQCINNLSVDELGASAQMLRCSRPMVHDVYELVLNETGQYIALVGHDGLSVVQLPPKSGSRGLFENGKHTISCRTRCVDEMLLHRHQELRIQQASWFPVPGSTTALHILLLTSDNVLRLYNVLETDSPLLTIPLPGGSTQITAALGETAVAFDFGLPVEIANHRKGSQDSTNDIFFPVYVVRGQGDVIQVMMPSTNRLRKPKLFQLSMFPPADDNYGCDFCSMVYLPTTPAVLVLASSLGTLQHCVILDSETDSDIGYDDEGEARTAESTLFVYETVDLELTLANDFIESASNLTDSSTGDSYTISKSMMLKIDALRDGHYYVWHSSGVHSIELTWLTKMSTFCVEQSRNNTESLFQLSHDEPSVVEHILDTKPIPDSPSSAVQGLLPVNDISSSCLVGLSGDMQLFSFYHKSKINLPRLPLLSSEDVEVAASPLRKLHENDFQERIRNILKRNMSNPVLMCGKSQTVVNHQQCFELLSHVTQVFREEYIQKQDMAREEIEKRAALLRKQKCQQQSELTDFNQSKQVVTEKACELAEKYDALHENQVDQLHRIDVLVNTIETSLPYLSNSEKTTRIELEDMSEKLKHLQVSFKKVKTNYEYYSMQNCLQKARQRSSALPVLSPVKETNMRKLLNDQSNRIQQLVTQVNTLMSAAED